MIENLEQVEKQLKDYYWDIHHQKYLPRDIWIEFINLKPSDEVKDTLDNHNDKEHLEMLCEEIIKLRTEEGGFFRVSDYIFEYAFFLLMKILEDNDEFYYRRE